ncbi:hypothetical protein HGRIS_014571 [Hohenbuehelia grisea]|uniref:ER transporter 6TM N-terminal domain-containing protein n=1 Tax=Hohenbuehelia grisea TaxID=104357 RepID=A0ABR3JU50_9AGAR
MALLPDLRWITANCSWSKIKPALRCAVAAWAGTVLFVIPSVEIFMGQASFLILIVAFLSPPSDPFMSVLEREFLLILFACLAWAWSCLGIRLAHFARATRDPTAPLSAIFTGQYIEAAPSIILAVFIFVGSAFFLYIKARQGPGPFLLASIFACIGLDIALTTAVLFPYPFYNIGKAIIIPLGFHSAIALLTSIFVFPSTISAQFTTRLSTVLSPLKQSIDTHRLLLKKDSEDADFPTMAESARATVRESEAGLVPLAASARLLRSDLIYSRFAPSDWRDLQKTARRIAVRANGLNVYLGLVDPSKPKFPVTPAPSAPVTPVAHTPAHSRPPSVAPIRTHDLEGKANRGDQSETVTPTATTPTLASATTRHTEAHGHHFPFIHGHHGHHGHAHRHSSHAHAHSHILHTNLLHLSLTRSPKPEHAVGVFESQRYLNLEATRLHDPDDAEHTKESMALLSASCDTLLEACTDGISAITSWLPGVRKGRWRFWVSRKERQREWQTRYDALKKARDALHQALQAFENEKRHLVLEPYHGAFEPKPDAQDQPAPPHRHLFHCYVYQYHLNHLSHNLLDLFDQILHLESERRANKLWTPAHDATFWSTWQPAENIEHDDDENPELIQGIPPAWSDLGEPQPRDPDALPPRNAFEWLMNGLYRFTKALGHGNAVFALKAGALTVIMCLPSFIKASAAFAYSNRFVWAIFMAQLTLARFRGDTTFGLVARILATFWGGLVGLVMWYISTGSGHGNPYGFAAVCAVCFPFFFYARLYWPGPPMTNIIFFVTAILVLGYSYQDNYIVLASNPGTGWSVFWRRFLLVTVGVAAAFIFSFFPPSTTIRRYQRTTLATTVSELGAIYCSIVSFAHLPHEEAAQGIITSLIAVRSKLNRSMILRTNVVYEFSLRGRWPAERYHRILELQLQIAYSLSHLMSVVEHMEPAWTRAFLRRTRLLDSDFQGDVLAVISMVSTSLKTGNPLPQITPCPLLDRFMERSHGLNIIHDDSEEDYGLPRTLTLQTLQNPQYIKFCVGVSTAYGIVTQLDRLMMATKEIVGEQYHIHGLGLGPEQSQKTEGVPLGPRISSVRYAQGV